MQKDHQQDIHQHQQAIKDCEYTSYSVQECDFACAKRYLPGPAKTCLDQIHDRIISLHVPSINDASNDNIDMIVEKNTNPEEDEFYEFPYYTVRIHRLFITIKKQLGRLQYLDQRFIVEEMYNANSTSAFNRFEGKEHLERFQCPFRLSDLARDASCAG